MSEQGQTTPMQMDAALAGMVDQIGQRRPQMVAVQSAPVNSIGAMAVARRLEVLTKQAELLATALAGPEKSPPGPARTDRPKAEHLFGKQMQGLDELGQQLDAIHGAIERAARSLT